MGGARPAPRRLLSGFVGRIPYLEAVTFQEEVRHALKQGEELEALLLLEHPHVYTLGRNASQRDVVASAGWLRDRGVEVHATNRGGQVTYHGPGQLVGYPILHLEPERRDVRRYMRDLMEVLVRTLEDFGLSATAGVEKERVGVWVGGKKVASLGVHLRRWITIHGFALNVTTDLSYFSGIVPCGLQGVSMASIESLTGARPSLAEVAERCVRHFARIFVRHPVPVAESQRLLRWLGRLPDAGVPVEEQSCRY